MAGTLHVMTNQDGNRSEASVPARLVGQVALVTGGGTGIGSATARRLAAFANCPLHSFHGYT
jgi:FlaA1/EpsC-like NDP-sugar epimerase